MNGPPRVLLPKHIFHKDGPVTGCLLNSISSAKALNIPRIYIYDCKITDQAQWNSYLAELNESDGLRMEDTERKQIHNHGMARTGGLEVPLCSQQWASSVTSTQTQG